MTLTPEDTQTLTTLESGAVVSIDNEGALHPRWPIADGSRDWGQVVTGRCADVVRLHRPTDEPGCFEVAYALRGSDLTRRFPEVG